MSDRLHVAVSWWNKACLCSSWCIYFFWACNLSKFAICIRLVFFVSSLMMGMLSTAESTTSLNPVIFAPIGVESRT
ncbi:putative DNA helicase MCM9 [Zea mays]|uniref:Putative DNA helicase MCM9 n=1 Tax=Zea mays TaxID=4577 RepID=A0A1D6LVG1_MAIZE|nr:putative DNA helicase MCM9 [Zea mays]